MEFGLAAVLSGCDDAQTRIPVEPLPRPVTYTTLPVVIPSQRVRMTGSVESWKKQDVSFEVAGRVRFVSEPGAIVSGPVLDASGRSMRPASLIARIDGARYALSAEEARAQVAALEAERAALDCDIEKTLPSELREVMAELDRAKKDFERQERLLKSGARAQVRVDEARSQGQGTLSASAEGRFVRAASSIGGASPSSMCEG